MRTFHWPEEDCVQRAANADTFLRRQVRSTDKQFIMKIANLSAAMCITLILSACGHTVETVYRFPAPSTKAQRVRVSKSVDATAAEFGFVPTRIDAESALIHDTRDYSIRRQRECILRLIQGTQANATYVLLHEMSRTKSDAFSQVESVLTNTFRRTEPGVIVDSRVGLIPF